MTDFLLPYDNIVIIENCVIDRNFGSGILSLSVVLVVRNCTFGPNNTNDGEPEDVIIRRPPGVPGRFLNCIFTKEIFDSDADVRFSCIPGTAGEENIDADPLWVDPENGDYHLRVGSPCIDSGTDTGLTVDLDGNPRPVDVIGTGIDGPGAYDMGAYEFQLSPADLDSNGYVNSRDLILFQDRWQDSE